MQTTCPECRTTFRVSQDHLGSRRGLVRCGSCNAVFNAYDTLLPELESPPGDVGPEAAAHQTENRQSELAQPAESVSGPEPAAQEQSSSEALSASASDKAVPDILLEPIGKPSAKPPLTWKFWFYLLLALCLAGLLAVQATYFLRAEMVATMPATRPGLEALCRLLHCAVPLPRQLAQDAIAASSLEHDQENRSRVRLTVLLANRTGYAQAWPHITLSLSDVRQAPVARKTFRPQAYLPAEVDVAAGIRAGEEREVRLDLDIGNLVASGYGLSLGYP
jgi:predicted Zn finger-like uncharacterized protein